MECTTHLSFMSCPCRAPSCNALTGASGSVRVRVGSDTHPLLQRRRLWRRTFRHQSADALDLVDEPQHLAWCAEA
ncbi:hypothetical protein EON67_03985 [archaeon]|nr:MAG: hypothetical protein EON67_03985 [archaeon]